MAEQDERIDPDLEIGSEPHQDTVDATGRAYGVAEIDSGALKPSVEIADARDRRRAFAEEPDPTEE